MPRSGRNERARQTKDEEKQWQRECKKSGHRIRGQHMGKPRKNRAAARTHVGRPNLCDGRAATQPQTIIFALGAADEGDSGAHPLSRTRGRFRHRTGSSPRMWLNLGESRLKVAETDKRKRATIKFSRRFFTAAPLQWGAFLVKRWKVCRQLEENCSAAECKLLLHRIINEILWTAARMIHLQ